MRVVNSIVLGITAMAGLSAAQTFDATDTVCACTQCCNVLNSTTFTGTDIQQITFPTTSFDGSYTLVDYGTHDNGQARRLSEVGSSFRGADKRELAIIAGTPYQHVVRYRKEDGTGKFLYNPQIYASSGPLDCTQSHVYWRIMETETVTAGVTYTAGDLMQIPLVQSSNGAFCEMDETAGVFDDGSGQGVSLKMLEQPDEVYFAFNKLVDEGANYFIQFNRQKSALLEPIDSTIQYQYKIRDNSVVVTEEEVGGEFFIRVVFDVQDIENDVDPDPACLSLDDVVSGANAYFGSADGSIMCPIVYNNPPTGDKDIGNGRTYDLKFNQSSYEDCAEALNVVNGNLQFQTTMRLLTGSIGDNCFYFMPGSSQQAININMEADVTDRTSATLGLFSTELISLTPERCTPFDTYPEPQARIKVQINVTYALAAGNTIERVTTSIPTFTDSPINLVPDSQGGGDAYTCTDTVTTSGTFKECTYYFVSDACERIYTTQNSECAFEYNSTRLIENLVFRENYAGGYFVIRRSEPIDTSLQATAFDLNLCQAPDEAPAIDVSDTFNSSIALRNYYDGVAVNWGNSTGLNFNDKLIVRLGVGEAAEATFDNIELFIKTVTVTLRNPTENAFINQFSFNVLEKENLMDHSWTFFYEDPVFCSYYNSNGGNGDPEDKCQPFSDPFNDQTTRWNGYNSGGGLSQAMINNICQRTNVGSTGDDARNVVDNRNLDHFMFDPTKWFADNVNAFMEVTVSVSAVIQKCGSNETIPTARLLEAADSMGIDRNLQTLDPESQILYISKDIIVTVGGENGTTITVVETEKESIWEEHTGLLAGLIATSSVMFCIILGFGAFRLWRYRNDEYAAGKVVSKRSYMHNF
jgi:hypothetical protein